MIQNSKYNKWVNGLEKVHFDSILKSKDLKWLNHDRKRITEIVIMMRVGKLSI